jgi:hypothetical protein
MAHDPPKPGPWRELAVIERPSACSQFYASRAHATSVSQGRAIALNNVEVWAHNLVGGLRAVRERRAAMPSVGGSRKHRAPVHSVNPPDVSGLQSQVGRGNARTSDSSVARSNQAFATASSMALIGLQAAFSPTASTAKVMSDLG